MRRLQIVLRDCLPIRRQSLKVELTGQIIQLHTSASRMVHIQHMRRPSRQNPPQSLYYSFNSYVKDGNELGESVVTDRILFTETDGFESTSRRVGMRKFLKSLVRPAGIEPATCGFEARRSIQLSFGRTKLFHTLCSRIVKDASSAQGGRSAAR